MNIKRDRSHITSAAYLTEKGTRAAKTRALIEKVYVISNGGPTQTRRYASFAVKFFVTLFYLRNHS